MLLQFCARSRSYRRNHVTIKQTIVSGDSRLETGKRWIIGQMLQYNVWVYWRQDPCAVETPQRYDKYASYVVFQLIYLPDQCYMYIHVCTCLTLYLLWLKVASNLLRNIIKCTRCSEQSKTLKEAHVVMLQAQYSYQLETMIRDELTGDYCTARGSRSRLLIC